MRNRHPESAITQLHFCYQIKIRTRNITFAARGELIGTFNAVDLYVRSAPATSAAPAGDDKNNCRDHAQCHKFCGPA